MLGELTLNLYKRVSDKSKKKFKIPSKWLASYYKLSLNRPGLDAFTLKPQIKVFINTEPEKVSIVQDLVDVGIFVDEADLDINKTEVV